MVAPAERRADFRQATRGQLLGKRHTDLTWAHQAALAAAGGQIGATQPVVLRDGLEDGFQRDLPVLRLDDVPQRFAREFKRDWRVRERSAPAIASSMAG